MDAGLCQRACPSSSIAAALNRQAARSYAPLNIVPTVARLSARNSNARILAARENKKRRNKKLVAAFCGCACAFAEIDEAMREAGKARLPILLVCHSDSDAADDLRPSAEQYGFPGVVVDGDDAVAVYRVLTEAAAHARRGSGPTLIECKPVAPLRSRRKRQANPVLNMERYLQRKGPVPATKLKSAVVAEFRLAGTLEQGILVSVALQSLARKL